MSKQKRNRIPKKFKTVTKTKMHINSLANLTGPTTLEQKFQKNSDSSNLTRLLNQKGYAVIDAPQDWMLTKGNI